MALVSSRTMIIETVKIPEAPIPVRTLPAMKPVKSAARPDVVVPIASKTVEAKIVRRGVKTAASLPLRGPRALIAIRYADVNHDVFSNASRSPAIADWVVVKMDMLVDCRKMRLPRAMAEKTARSVVMDCETS